MISMIITLCIVLLAVNFVAIVAGVVAMGSLLRRGYRVSVWREEKKPERPYA